MPKSDTEVRHNLWGLYLELQLRVGHGYSWAEFARRTGLQRGQLQNIFEGEQTDRGSLTNGTVDSIMQFFEDEGMLIDFNDIYVRRKRQPDNDHPNPNP